MQDEELAQHQVSMLLFLALAFGIGMFLFTKIFGVQVLTGKSFKVNISILEGILYFRINCWKISFASLFCTFLLSQLKSHSFSYTQTKLAMLYKVAM
jgi:hypothetical protein